MTRHLREAPRATRGVLRSLAKNHPLRAGFVAISAALALVAAAACSSDVSGLEYGATERDASATESSSAAQTGSVTLDPGVSFVAALAQDVSSGQAVSGQDVEATVARPLGVNGVPVIPAGSVVVGSVTSVRPAKRFGGQAALAIAFHSLRLDGREVAVSGELAVQAKKETAKDAATIAGSAAGGGVLGEAVGDDTESTAAGVIVGGAIGTAVASRKGAEAIAPAGTEITITLDESVTVPR